MKEQRKWEPLSEQWVKMMERNLPDPPTEPVKKADAIRMKWEHSSHLDLEKGGFANVFHCKTLGIWRLIVRWERGGPQFKHLGIKGHGELIDTKVSTIQKLIEIGAVVE
jgi:hypothetical protein